MNANFKKIASTFLALLVTISTFSITVEKHFCGDFLVDVSYLGNADSCNSDENLSSPTKMSCCDDEIVHLEGQKKLQKSTIENFDFPNFYFLVLNSFDFENTSLSSTVKTIVFEAYLPPKLITDILISQAVLII